MATLDDLVGLLSGHRIVVLTGAGVSTDSGIPDYRGPNSPQRTPMTYQQFVSDERFRRHYWARNQVGWRHVAGRHPNAGHRALAELERRGIVVGVITQNVDLLHEAAGSRRVIDLHGRYDEVRCLRCGARYSRDEVADRLDELNPGFVEAIGEVGDVEIAPDADAVIERTSDFVVAPCWAPDPDGGPGRCGGILKPDIVYFGETVPPARVAAAYALVDEADAMLVAGSSLAVQSGLRFVRHADAAGKPIAIVNRGTTRGDRYAAVTLHAGTSEVLAALLALLPAPLAALDPPVSR
ncbi:MAG TPA: Sir2 family NAD-dependent protein deacetylase [Cellulomonas sp.]